MNNYGFHFAESYQGYWNIAQIGRKIPGTLYIEKHSIRLELFWNNITSSDIRAISSGWIRGLSRDPPAKELYQLTS